jgi:hypothetical protein
VSLAGQFVNGLYLMIHLLIILTKRHNFCKGHGYNHYLIYYEIILGLCTQINYDLNLLVRDSLIIKQCRMSEVTGCGILKFFFNKEC